MSKDHFYEIRQDCLRAFSEQPEILSKLRSKHISVTGGTGFLGTWVTETIAALNDEHKLDITLSLYARNISDWAQKYPHLSERSDVHLKAQDIRSPFEFHNNTNFIIHAAGIPNNRVHSSDPLRVHQTTVLGISNALQAATKLQYLNRFLNVSSCLVNGKPTRSGELHETEYFPIPAGQLHSVYAEAKRSAESLAAIYRSQFRMPISTIRPFTFAGPFQELDRPWAINNFLRDALTSNDIRIHGDGSARRSYLYGSDAAWWTLAALINGIDGQIYNIGSPTPITHIDLAKMISAQFSPKLNFMLNTAPSKHLQQDDLFPNIDHTQKSLGVSQTSPLEETIKKTGSWFSTELAK
jgi:nucleoside-diphosphate-sugar epimerase